MLLHTLCLLLKSQSSALQTDPVGLCPFPSKAEALLASAVKPSQRLWLARSLSWGHPQRAAASTRKGGSSAPGVSVTDDFLNNLAQATQLLQVCVM